jgi:hypothetical protein
MIRELKQKIEDLRAEIDALMADQSMDPETKKSRVGALQAFMSSLISGLATANHELVKQGTSGKLSSDQVKQANILAMK